MYRIEYEPIPNRGYHVVLRNDNGVELLCGSMARRFWPIGQEPTPESAPTVSVKMDYVRLCDHAGVYRQPRSVWTGELAL